MTTNQCPDILNYIQKSFYESSDLPFGSRGISDGVRAISAQMLLWVGRLEVAHFSKPSAFPPSYYNPERSRHTVGYLSSPPGEVARDQVPYCVGNFSLRLMNYMSHFNKSISDSYESISEPNHGQAILEPLQEYQHITRCISNISRATYKLTEGPLIYGDVSSLWDELRRICKAMNVRLHDVIVYTMEGEHTDTCGRAVVRNASPPRHGTTAASCCFCLRSADKIS